MSAWLWFVCRHEAHKIVTVDTHIKHNQLFNTINNSWSIALFSQKSCLYCTVYLWTSAWDTTLTKVDVSIQICAVLPKWELIVYEVSWKYINLASSSEGFTAASNSSRHAHHWPTCLLFDDRFIGMSWQGTSGVCHISSVTDSDLVSLNGCNLCSPWSSCEFWPCSIPAPPCATGPWHWLPLQVPTVRPNAG